MSITNDGKCFSCDYCGQSFESEDFGDALKQIRAGNWKAIFNNGQWEHICEDCQTAYDGY